MPLRVSGRGLLIVVASVLAAAILANASAMAQPQTVGATADVRDAAGRLLATGEFREGRGEVLITLIFPSPAPLSGTHAVHIQDVGRCDPPDFLTAGADFNPYNKRHGRQNPDGSHVGDLPNVNFTSGLTTYNTSAPGATLGAGPGSLLGPNRTALVIYSAEDDQKTDPDGNSGARIGCGVIAAAPGPGAVAPPKPVAAQPALPTPVSSPAPVNKPGAVQPSPVPPASAKPGVSPVPAQPGVPKPVVSPAPTPAAAASAIAIVVPAPTAPAPFPAAATSTSGSSLGTGPALLIAVLGVGLIGAGYLLRQRSQLRR